MRITVALLKELNACSGGIDKFEKFLNGRKYVLPTQRNLQLAAEHTAASDYVPWLVAKLKLTCVLDFGLGEKHWYQCGLLHREGGPAVIYPNGVRKWYLNGRLHRDDGPAVIYFNGLQLWYRDGRYVCSDRP